MNAIVDRKLVKLPAAVFAGFAIQFAGVAAFVAIAKILITGEWSKAAVIAATFLAMAGLLWTVGKSRSFGHTTLLAALLALGWRVSDWHTG
jgi:hypothetical protein